MLRKDYILSCLRQIILSLFTMICSISYAYDFEVDGLWYKIIGNDQVEVAGLVDRSYSGTLQIPETVNYLNNVYYVTSIGFHAFYDCIGLTGDLNIPNSITRIDSWAFAGCSNLTGKLIIPNSITYIGDNAFSGCCGFTGSLTIPNSITKIDDSVFRDCSGLTGSLTIPNSVLSIGGSAFQNCSGFTGSLTISNSVTTIEEWCFYGCSGFTGTLVIPNSVTTIKDHAFEGCCGFSGSLIIPNSVTSIKLRSFSGCSGFNGSLTIPNSVTSIGNGAFQNCSGLTGLLTIPNSITSLSESVFWGCSGFVGELKIPNSVVSIGKGAFSDCSGFTGSLEIPNSVITIGEGAFSGCSGFNGSLTIPNSVTSIGSAAFFNCIGFTGPLSIPNSITKIESFVFQQCRGFDGELTIPNSVTSIGDGVFWSCSRLTGALTIPNSVISIGEGAFYNCRGFTGELTIPNSITSIRKSTFELCNGLTSVVIPNGITTIYGNAFQGCGELMVVTLGKDLISIGGETFGNCGKLEIVNSNITSPFSIAESTFSNISSSALLHIPKGTKSSYLQYSGWTSHFKYILEEGESNPSNTYSLSITSRGNGFVTYGDESIRETTKSYTINEGSSVSLGFNPDSGFRIKSLKVNGSTVTASTTYTATINADTSIEVGFEAIPATTYTLSIKATGNGSASYSGETIRGKTKSYTVNEGTSVTILFTPDNGYRIKSLKVNGSSVTASNSYTTTINADTSIEVEFEEIPDIPTTYSLTIKATGNGSASYGGETIRNTKKSYTVDEGASVTITFSPDDSYRIKSLKVNNVDATVSDSYTTKVNADTKIEVEFEEIPVPTYLLSIKAVSNGSATYKNKTVRDDIQTFTVNEGSDVTIAFTPDDGYRIKSVKHDGEDVTQNMIENSYIISNIHADATVEVEFEERVNSFSANGISYQVTSWEGHSLTVVAAGDDLIIEIPDKISSQDEEWTVTGIDGNVLDDHETLAAIIWNPEAPFTARVTNPNLLLYVKDEQYAPATIKNVVVNGYAKSITLTDAQSGNNFYCPEAFTAQSISYTHNYLMKTGLHESRGWETIALPFDVQKVSHSSKGEIVPYARWTSGSSVKPFWLYELSGSGFVETEGIKANTPYIISMPNNEAYPNEYHLTGRISFSSENVTVERSSELQVSTFSDRSFTPNFICRDANAGYYALNVSNDYEYYQGSENEGSRFILNLRQIHPFEAYMTSSANTRSIGIFDDMTTDIRGIEILANEETIKVYDLSGKLLRIGTSLEDMKQGLPAGVYIVNHQKIMIK